MMTVLAFFVTLGVLITFHELGHYSVARACGVRVLRFSIGFGQVLFKRTDRHGTEWAVSMIPLGGYVKMLEDPPADGADSDRKSAFKAQPVAARFAIVAAGPVFNLLLAVGLYAVLNIVGVREPVALLTAVPAQTAASSAGLQAGDLITAVNDVNTPSWPQVRYQLLRAVTEGGEVDLTIDRKGVVLNKHLVLSAHTDAVDSDPLKLAGLQLSQGRPIVQKVSPGSVGESAGLQEGDVIKSVGEILDPDVSQLIGFIQSKPSQLITLTLERAGKTIQLNLEPRKETLSDGSSVGRIGVQLAGDVKQTLVQYGLGESVWLGAERTFDTALFSLKMMGKMLVGEVSWRNVSGPLTIADYAGQTAKLGLSAYISFLALISISLGVLNLLPIPMLDGGYLLYYLIEIVKGRPIDEKWMVMAQKPGMIILAGLMVLALFNDFMRLLS